MSTFYAYWEQGGGCDYTIGCGVQLEKLPGSELQEATRHAIDDHPNRFEEGSDDEVVALTILEVVDATKIDVADIKLQMFQRAVADAAQKTENEERAEFERLRAKFGDK